MIDPVEIRAARWTAVAERVRVGGALPVTYRVVGDRMFVEMLVPDVDTGEPFLIEYSRELPHLSEPAAMMRWLRDCALYFYEHELDEQFRYNETRVFFPEHQHES